MKNYYDIDGKTLTENPLLDEIVYNCKYIINNGIVLKDEMEAISAETLESIKYSDKYITCIEGTVKFEEFMYSIQDLNAVGIIDLDLIKLYTSDNSLIPIKYRDILLKNAINSFVNSYEELNPYYRTLNGTPPINTLGVVVQEEDIPSNIISQFIDILPCPIHTLSNVQIDLLDSTGILNEYKTKFPKFKYLNYLGSKRINIYKARKSTKFQILYISPCPSTQIYIRFQELLEKNRILFIHTIYTNAYSFDSDYYDKFIIIMIILQTFTDMIVELPDYIIRRDIFDSRTIKYIFESNGVEYYSDIPLKYQISLVRNLNRLIKLSSTDQNLIDICSLFGCKNIKIFRYYILKDRTVDKFSLELELDDNGNLIEKENQNINNFYDLKFIRVPLDGIYDDYIRDAENHHNYDTVTLQDEYWDGDKDHEYVKQQLLSKEFNVLRSKYYVIEAIYDITEMTFELVYFMNIFMNGNINADALKLKLPIISSSVEFRVVDVIQCLYSLGYIYYDANDSIIWNQKDVLYIKGFNFDVDMNTLSQYVEDRGYTLVELGVANFKIPDNSTITINNLMDIYTTNKSINIHLVNMMKEADDKEIYDIYKYLYDSLMVVQLNREYLKDKNGNYANTITDYLEAHSPILYNLVIECKNIKKIDERQSIIANYTSSIADALDSYLETEGMDYIISSVPGVSLDYIKEYMNKVVNFFKSFKITMLQPTTIYSFSDKYENTIFIIDSILLKYWFDKTEVISIINRIYEHGYLNEIEKIDLIEKIYKYISWYLQLPKDIKIKIREKIFCSENTNKLEKVNIDAIFNSISSIYDFKSSIIEYFDTYNRTDNISPDDYIIIMDYLIIKYMNNTFNDMTKIKDIINYLIYTYDYRYYFIQNEVINIISKINKNETVSIDEYIYKKYI